MTRDEAYQRAEKKIAAARQPRVRSLDLSRMHLTELPESLGHLTQLWEMYISDNQLTKLPKSIGQLTWLEWLDLSDNQLEALPETLGQLVQLQVLFLENNQLMALPNNPELLFGFDPFASSIAPPNKSSSDGSSFFAYLDFGNKENTFSRIHSVVSTTSGWSGSTKLLL